MSCIDELIQVHSRYCPSCREFSIRAGGHNIAVPSEHAVAFRCDNCKVYTGEDVRPDFIAFFEHSSHQKHYWAVIESKGRIGKTSEIVRQLQSGADTIEGSDMFRLNNRVNDALVPIVLFTGKTRSADFVILRQNRIRFRSHKYGIAAYRCKPGLSLSDLLPR